MRRMLYLALCLPLVGFAACAKAGQPDVIGGHPDAGGITHPDSTAPLIDAYVPPIVDAPPGQQTKTLSQTTSNALKAGWSVACPATTIGTAANKYYRVFDLPALGITTDFHVSTVTFQVEDCESVGTNGAVVAVRVGTYNGTPTGSTLTGAMTVLASNATVQVPEVDETTGPPASTPGATVNAPIAATIPAGQKLFVEIDAPDGNNTYQLYIGSNDGGQSALGYMSSPSCTPPGTIPTDIGSLLAPAEQIDLLITVTGTY